MSDKMRHSLAGRARLLAATRSWLDAEGLVEVDTSLLQECPIPEVGIELFSTHYHSPYSQGGKFFLIPSPEVGMKRLLAEGAGDIYQLGHCFRQEPWPGYWHGLEFSMLEWYRVGVDYLDNLRFTQRLLEHLDQGEGLLRRAWTVRTMDQLFSELLGVSLSEQLSRAGLQDLHQRFNLRWQEQDSEEQLFNRLFLSLVEPQLKSWGGLFVLDYPALIPTLARRKPDHRYAERWELYLDGIELANCCNEENRLCWLEHYFSQQEAGSEQHFSSLYRRLPFCSGAALGFDRLALLLHPDYDRLWPRRPGEFVLTR